MRHIAHTSMAQTHQFFKSLTNARIWIRNHKRHRLDTGNATINEYQRQVSLYQRLHSGGFHTLRYDDSPINALAQKILDKHILAFHAFRRRANQSGDPMPVEFILHRSNQIGEIRIVQIRNQQANSLSIRRAHGTSTLIGHIPHFLNSFQHQLSRIDRKAAFIVKYLGNSSSRHTGTLSNILQRHKRHSPLLAADTSSKQQFKCTLFTANIRNPAPTHGSQHRKPHPNHRIRITSTR